MRREALEGPERLCPRCKEWWPEESQFFSRHRTLGWKSWCIACSNERQAQQRAKAKAAGASGAGSVATTLI